MNWNDILKQYTNRALAAMCVAQRLNEFAGKVTPSTRARAIDQLRRVLGKPETVHRALQKVGPVETVAVKAILRAGGQADREQIHRAVEQAMPVPLPQYPAEASPDYQGTPSFEDALARAMCYGIIFSRDNREIDFKPGPFLFIPDPVIAALRADAMWQEALARAGDRSMEPGPAITPDLVLSSSASDFQRDLSRYLRHVRRQGHVSLTTQGWIYKSNFKTFLAALNAPADAPGDEASNPRLWFMRRMLTAMGELHLTETGIQAYPPGKLLTMAMAQRVRLSYDTWCDTGAWNELNRIATEHQGYDYRRDAPPELAKAHGVMLRMIARQITNAITSQAPAGRVTSPTPAGAEDWLNRWLPVTAFIELVRRNEHQFLFSRKQRYRDYTGGVGNYNTPYYGTNNPYTMTFPTVKEERQGWDMVERQFIVNVLTGPLYWLGMVELGYRKGESPGEGVEPAGYRLTQVGAWLLGLAEPPGFIESGGRVLVQPSFTVIAMEPVSDTVLLALDEFADPQGGDRAVTYHLTRQSVYRAQRRGWDAARIRSFLEQHQGGDIPTNVRRSLDEWQVLHQRITFHRAAPVLQYADEAARAGVRETLAKTGVALDSLSPNFDLLGADLDGGQGVPSLAGITDALSEAGWMPLVTPRHADAQTEGSLRIDEAGEISFKQAVPNIYALSQLAPVTEGSDGRRRITAQCVRAAMSGGMTLDELLTILAHLHDGPLPQKVETNIRAWAGFYGEASLKSIHLLELTSLEVLNNLLMDEQVGQFLKPIEGSTTPLALVDTQNVAQVRAVLLERGVGIREG